MRLGTYENAQTVAFDPMGLNMWVGSLASVPKNRGQHDRVDIVGLVHTSCPITVSVDTEHTDSSLVAHSLFRDANDLVVGLVEGYAFDGCGKFPLV